MSTLDDILNPQASSNNNDPESAVVATEQEPESSSEEDETDDSLGSDEEIDELEASDQGGSDDPSPAVRAKSEQNSENSYLLTPGEGPPSADLRQDQIALSSETTAPTENVEKPPTPRKRVTRRHDKKIDLVHNHRPHDDCPDTLACLPDTDGRPGHTLPVILRCCILGSPLKRLTIREIYAAMENKYPYYRGAGDTWKQSVRHHLSLNRLFERQPRPVTDPGFGSYWTVNLLAPPGTKRPRKRGVKLLRDGDEPESPPRNAEIALAQPPPTNFRYQFQPQSHPPPPSPPIPQPPVHNLYPVSPLTRNPLHTPSPFQPQPQQQPYSQISLQNSQQQQALQLQYSMNSAQRVQHQHQPYPTQPSSQYLPRPPPQSQHSQSNIPITNQPQQPVFMPVHVYVPSSQQHPPPPQQQQQQARQPPPPTNHPPQLQSPTQLHAQRQQELQKRHKATQQREQEMQHRQQDSQPRSVPPALHRRRSSAAASTPVTPFSERQPESHRSAQSPHHLRKPSTPVTPISSGREASYPPSSGTEDGAPNDISGPTVSDDEMESEEEVEHTQRRRRSMPPAFIPTRPAPIFSLPPFSALEHDKEDILEHMRQEIASLRRTSAEAVSTSLRLTEQLAHANLEVSRSREAVRDLEDMLQHEASKRKDAERLKEAEIERRRHAERTLNDFAVKAHAVASQSSPTRSRQT